MGNVQSQQNTNSLTVANPLPIPVAVNFNGNEVPIPAGQQVVKQYAPTTVVLMRAFPRGPQAAMYQMSDQRGQNMSVGNVALNVAVINEAAGGHPKLGFV